IEYDGNQIKKITKKDNTLSQPLIISSELHYSGTQVAEISGTVSQSGVILETFATEIIYNGDQPAIITTAYYLPGNASAIRTLKSELSYSGFNISKWVYTIDDASIPGSPVVTTTNYSDYDTHQNPFRTLPVPLILSNVHHEGHLVGISALSISNYKTMTVQSSAGSHTENVVLAYDSEGFLETSKQAGTTLYFEYIPYYQSIHQVKIPALCWDFPSFAKIELKNYFKKMKYLIVGLGNKGVEYAETRHNVGFKVAEHLAKVIDAPFKTANFGWIAEGKYKSRKIFILKPDTYMNLSGKAVKYWMQKENIPLEN